MSDYDSNNLQASIDLALRAARKHLQDPILTRVEATLVLGVSLATLKRWAEHGYGPAAFKVGGQLRYRLSSIERFIADAESGS